MNVLHLTHLRVCWCDQGHLHTSSLIDRRQEYAKKSLTCQYAEEKAASEQIVVSFFKNWPHCVLCGRNHIQQASRTLTFYIKGKTPQRHLLNLESCMSEAA